jgi:hypothetical protein
MKPMELAHKYMEIFYNGGDIEELSHLFAPHMHFQGPLYVFKTAHEYIGSLKASPPERLGYEIIKEFEDDSTACIFYHFQKDRISTPMAQLFEVENDRISRILLVFDTADLQQSVI